MKWPISRFWGWTIAIVVILFGLSALSTSLSQKSMNQQEFFSNRSVFNAKQSGYRAWHLMMQQVDKTNRLPSISIWKRPFSDLRKKEVAPPLNATMLIVEPFSVSGYRAMMTHEDEQALSAWVLKGNTLILLDPFDRPRMRAVLNDLGLKTTPLANPKYNLPLQVSPHYRALNTYLREPVRTQSRQALKPATGLLEMPEPVLNTGNGKTVLWKMTHGKGSIYVGSVPDLASNQQLAETDRDNYQLLTNLLLSIGKPIVINEYVHGHQLSNDLFLFYYEQTPLGQIAIQLAFGFGLLLWWSFTPWRPRREVLVEEDTAPIPMQAFVQSLAGIYYKSDAASLLLNPYLQTIETSLRKKYRVSIDDQAALTSVLDTLGVEADPALRQRRVSDTLALLARAQEMGKNTKPFKNKNKLLHDAKALAHLSRQLSGTSILL